MHDPLTYQRYTASNISPRYAGDLMSASHLLYLLLQHSVNNTPSVPPRTACELAFRTSEIE